MHEFVETDQRNSKTHTPHCVSFNTLWISHSPSLLEESSKTRQQWKRNNNNNHLATSFFLEPFTFSERTQNGTQNKVPSMRIVELKKSKLPNLIGFMSSSAFLRISCPCLSSICCSLNSARLLPPCCVGLKHF